MFERVEIGQIDTRLRRNGSREPLRIPGGITQQTDPNAALFMMPGDDPTRVYRYFNDFSSLSEFNGITDTASWDVTATGAGTFALADGAFGIGLITNAAADDDAVFFQKKGESFKFVAGKQAWFKVLFKVNDATQSDFIFGLIISDSTPLDHTDGVYFQKDDGDALLDFHVEKNNTKSDATGIHTVVSDTFLSIAFYFDGATFFYYVNDVLKGSVANTNLPDDEELTVSFGVQNGEAVAKTMHLDLIFAAIER